jgi:hypothetical protein
MNIGLVDDSEKYKEISLIIAGRFIKIKTINTRRSPAFPKETKFDLLLTTSPLIGYALRSV